MSVETLRRSSDWSAYRFGVVGLGVAGFACADALSQVGAQTWAIDASTDQSVTEKATLLEMLDVHVQTGAAAALPTELDVLVVSPGLRPSHPIITDAQARGIVVWGELELAWRLRDEQRNVPWLAVTGTNGKTTTTLMLESILRADGRHAVAAGNIGNSVVHTVMDPDGPDVIALEVGAPQMPFTSSMSPYASVCLNIAEDHVDHFGSFDAYVQTKGRTYQNTQVAAVYNVQDPATERLVEQADVVEGCRAIGFTLGTPGLSMLGVVEDVLVDRAFIDNRASHAQELATFDDIHPFAAHNVANALAAAALARAYGVQPSAVRDGLRTFELEHGIGKLLALGGITEAVRVCDEDLDLRIYGLGALHVSSYELVDAGTLDTTDRTDHSVRVDLLIALDRRHHRRKCARKVRSLLLLEEHVHDVGTARFVVDLGVQHVRVLRSHRGYGIGHGVFK